MPIHADGDSLPVVDVAGLSGLAGFSSAGDLLLFLCRFSSLGLYRPLVLLSSFSSFSLI